MAKRKPSGGGENYPSLFDQVKDQRAELLKEVARVEAQLKRIYGASYKEALELAAVRRAIEQGGDFSWDANAAASSQLTKVLNNLQSATNALLSNSVVASWEKGEKNVEKNLYAALGGGKAGKEAIKATAEKARSAMRERGATAGGYLTKNEGGFSISERVWKLTEDAKRELQIVIQNGIKEGKTPDEIARSAQQYLKEPAKLFRRVKDKETGNLELSKAAKEYHPGQGVYRSSYKNALRLARTEITAAYRRAEWESYQSNPLIIGYEIRLSNNHTTTLPNGKTVKLTDICDRMAGRYPKTFLWTGWHPQCRCVMIPITISKEDFKARIKALKKGQLQEWKPKETVTEMPAGFNDWIKENTKRVQQAKARPYWITENYKGGDIKKGLIRAIANLKEEVKKQQEIITEFDGQIAMLERWKDALNLNLTEIYRLRTSGQRAALEAAVDKMTDDAMHRISLWSEAGNELYQLQEKARKAGFNEIAASIKTVMDAYGSGNQPGKKYLACIAHLRNAKKDYEAALNEAIARKKESGGTENERLISEKLGITKGEPMDFDAANERRGNTGYIPRYIGEGANIRPNPDYNKANDHAYHINCQSCVVANELRRRGYDVTAQPNTGKGCLPEELSYDTAKIWIDPATGKAPQKQTAGGWYMEGYRIKSKTRSVMLKEFVELTKEPGRYHIDWAWTRGNSGHIITCERLPNGKLRIYDPQDGEIITDFKTYSKGFSLRHGIRVLRVDGLRVNTDMIAGIVKASGK